VPRATVREGAVKLRCSIAGAGASRFARSAGNIASKSPIAHSIAHFYKM
jgi:hypothetical protein